MLVSQPHTRRRKIEEMTKMLTSRKIEWGAERVKVRQLPTSSRDDVRGYGIGWCEMHLNKLNHTWSPADARSIDTATTCRKKPAESPSVKLVRAVRREWCTIS